MQIRRRNVETPTTQQATDPMRNHIEYEVHQSEDASTLGITEVGMDLDEGTANRRMEVHKPVHCPQSRIIVSPCHRMKVMRIGSEVLSREQVRLARWTHAFKSQSIFL